jgi:hypothetical protein
MRQRHQGRFQLADLGMDDLVARRLLAQRFCRLRHFAMDGRRRHPGLPQGHPLDKLLEGGRELPLVFIAPLLAGQSGQPFLAVAIDPAAGGAEDDTLFPGNLRQRDAVFQERADGLEPGESTRSCLVGQAAQ